MCPKCEKEEDEDVARTRLFPGHRGRVRQSWHWSIRGERPWIALGRRVPSTWCPRGSSSRTKHSGRDLDPPWCHLCCCAGRLREDGPVGSRDGKLDSSFRGCSRMPELWFPDGQLGRLPRWVWGWSSDVRIIWWATRHSRSGRRWRCHHYRSPIQGDCFSAVVIIWRGKPYKHSPSLKTQFSLTWPQGLGPTLGFVPRAAVHSWTRPLAPPALPALLPELEAAVCSIPWHPSCGGWESSQ